MFCFQCGRKIVSKPMTVSSFGTLVEIHKKCEKEFKGATVTARAVTSDAGRVYKDDDQHMNGRGEVYRRVYGKPGDEG